LTEEQSHKFSIKEVNKQQQVQYKKTKSQKFQLI